MYTKDIVRKIKMENSQSHDDACEYDYNSWCIWGRWTCWPEGVPEHDQVTPLLDGDEAGHLVLGMFVRSFSSVSEEFASSSGQAHIQVLASHSRLWPLVLCVFFFGASWFFRRGFCRVSDG
jgi:hypothetical protein